MKTTSEWNTLAYFFEKQKKKILFKKYFLTLFFLLIVSINQGFSQFTSEIIIDNTEHYNRIFVVDADKDNDKDVIAFVNNTNYNFVWIENLGSGNFTKHIIPSSFDGGPSDVKDMIVLDIEKDGDPDIMFSLQYTTNNKQLQRINNNGGGNFSTNFAWLTWTGSFDTPETLVTEDINKDGYSEILMSDNDIDFSVIYKNVNGTFNFWAGQTTDARDFTCGYLNNDTLLDVAFHSFDGNYTWIYYNNNSSFSKSLINHSARYGDMDNYDYDKDGDNDLVIANTSNSGWLQNLNNNGFSTTYSAWVPANKIKLEFISNSQYKDIIHSTGTTIVWTSDIATQSLTTTLSNIITDIQVSDFNKDGRKDILACSSGNNHGLVWFKNIINCSTISNINVSSCNYYTSPSGSYNWTNSGTYNDTILNNSGCDSIITINLTINSNSTNNVNAAICSGDTYLLPDSTIISTAGVYHDTLQNSNGCDSIIITTLTILPAINQNLNISACASYNWGGLILTSSGIYKDTLNSANACDSIVTLSLTITNIDNTISANLPTITSNQANANYQWVDCNNNYSFINGATNQSYIATSNGSYAVIITKNGCTDTSLCYQVTSTEINSFAEKTISIYPNPTNGEILINLNNITSNATITVKNIIGQIVFSETIYNKQTHEIELTNDKGVYFIEITINSNTKTFKVLKN